MATNFNMMRNLVKLYSSRGGAPFFVKVIVQCIKEGQKKEKKKSEAA